MKFCVYKCAETSDEFDTLGDAIRRAHTISSKTIFFIVGTECNTLRQNDAGEWVLDTCGGEKGYNYYDVPLHAHEPSGGELKVYDDDDPTEYDYHDRVVGKRKA